MYDTNLVLRPAAGTQSEGVLDASETSAVTGYDFGGPDMADMCYMVHVPAAFPSGTNPTLDVKIQESADNSTFVDFLAFPQIIAAGEYFVTGRSNQRYRRYQATIGGSNTPNFGATIIAPVPGGRSANW